jgi:chromosome partitioning protein
MELLAELHEFTLSGAIVRERKIYRDAIAEGRGVMEMGNEKAIAEVEIVAKEIYQLEVHQP